MRIGTGRPLRRVRAEREGRVAGVGGAVGMVEEKGEEVLVVAVVAERGWA